MTTADLTISPPGLGLLALEGRAGFEYAALLAIWPLLELTPRGDGHPVLVLPGWLASDFSTRALRAFLRRRGYHVHGWKLGRNVGPTPVMLDQVGQRFAAVRRRHQQKISLIGWSLGGIYARELARRFPDDVRQVITLASPFRDPTASNAARLFRFRANNPTRTGATARDIISRLRVPPPVPATSLYSRTDGIVAWQSCLEDEGPRHQNIEVPSSHIGMGHHPLALHIIADRLAQAEDDWQPFAPSGWDSWWLRVDSRSTGT